MTSICEHPSQPTSIDRKRIAMIRYLTPPTSHVIELIDRHDGIHVVVDDVVRFLPVVQAVDQLRPGTEIVVLIVPKRQKPNRTMQHLKIASPIVPNPRGSGGQVVCELINWPYNGVRLMSIDYLARCIGKRQRFSHNNARPLLLSST